MNLREQLAKKRARTTTETFPIGDEGEKAAKRLTDAEQALTMLKMLKAKNQDVDLSKAEAEYEAAVADYREHSLTLTFRGLSPDEVDALRDEFTPADGEKVDTKAYTAALLAASVVDSDLTAEEWTAELYESGRWSDGEVVKLRHAAQDAYSESPAPGIPKG